jgi:hypothetical protein
LIFVLILTLGAPLRYLNVGKGAKGNKSVLLHTYITLRQSDEEGWDILKWDTYI